MPRIKEKRDKIAGAIIYIKLGGYEWKDNTKAFASYKGIIK